MCPSKHPNKVSRKCASGLQCLSDTYPANAAMAAMNNAVIGSKQIVVRLHEPKQLRQEKLAARYSGGQPGSHPASPQRNSPRSNPHSPRLGYNGHHPRNSSGATSPTISEGGESVSYGHGWGSPRASMSAIGSPMGLGLTYSTPERGRRGSGSYYNVGSNYPSALQTSPLPGCGFKHPQLPFEL